MSNIQSIRKSIIIILFQSCIVYSQSFTNPILPGGYPDPSICKVGDYFYMVNSSFEYFPGLPVHKSKDLVNWTLIGHGLEREEQCTDEVNLVDVQSNGGIHAPTIRYNEGTFYIITTTVYFDEKTQRGGVTNFIVTATNPAGPWSDPIVVKGAPGIDPDLFFDDDGRLWYTGNHQPKNPEFNGQGEIWMQELNSNSLQLIGNRHLLWRGACDGVWAEGPHIYKRDGKYYLMIAEGGTSFNHAVMIAISDSITGPYVSNERNPIFSTRHLSYDNWVHSTGHADLIELNDGRWFMVLLGIRGDLNRGSNMGRETFIVPVKWELEPYEWKKEKFLWPVVAPQAGKVLRTNPLIFDSNTEIKSNKLVDEFDGKKLGLHWNFVRVPIYNSFSLSVNPGHLRLFSHPNTIAKRKQSAFTGIKQTESDFIYSAKMSFNPNAKNSEAGIAIVQKDDNYVSFTLLNEPKGIVIRLMHKDQKINLIKEQVISNYQGDIKFKIISENDIYSYYYSLDNNKFELFTTTSADLILSRGYTGAHIGLYITGNQKINDDYADYDWISYIPKQRQ